MRGQRTLSKNPTWPSIGFFDSGIGGFSIVPTVLSSIPTGRIIYCADYALFPYGIKQDTQIEDRATRIVSHLTRREPIDILVIACSTLSTLALDRIRAELPIPVVGVVPAIKPGAERTTTGHIAVLATKATVARPYTQQLIAEFASECTIELVGSNILVEQAERKILKKSVDLDSIRQELAPIANNSAIDTVILACTHFPLLLPELKQVLGDKIQWLDPAQAIARRIITLLEKKPPNHSAPGPHRLYCTEARPGLDEHLSTIIGNRMESQVLSDLIL